MLFENEYDEQWEPQEALIDWQVGRIVGQKHETGYDVLLGQHLHPWR